MKRTVKTTKAQKVPMEKLLFQLEMVLFSAGWVQPSAVCCTRLSGWRDPMARFARAGCCVQGPRSSPCSLFQGREWPGSLPQHEIQMSQDSFLAWKFSAQHQPPWGQKKEEKKFILSLVWVGTT